ncbi:MAG: thermonuclease family protein [Deltaproteobacteria bacterium]
MKPGRDPIVVLIFIALALGFYFFSGEDDGKGDGVSFRVVEVVDGDTVIIDDEKNSRVRYLGLDSPEIAVQDSPGDPLSEEARDFNAALVEGKRVRLEFDKEKYDVYGRLLAYVYADSLFVNLEILRGGLAIPLIIEPNGRYSDLIYEATEEARRLRKGMWSELNSFDTPPGNLDFTIDIQNAPRYEGKRVLVSGLVTGAKKSEKATVISIEDSFDIVIFSDDWGNFKFFGIDPGIYYKGRRVEVTGRVRMYRGTPGMIVDHPMLIRVVE